MTALARKYRPAKLHDLLGQDALVTALDAAFTHDRIPQAIILTGVRGVGKTTTARIIARSVNCEQGPTATPCGACGSCTEIAADGSLDVIEMDAASQTGVEAMRELIENVSYAPMRPGARKVYILDEAHMLSNSAWNALLKTLEEPPAHVIFIFATTEPRKIPATIQSRCQKFALARIDRATISARLSAVAQAEGVRLEDNVAELIAQAGRGSMRDALSILDQAISGSAGAVRLDDVRAMIGRGTPTALLDTLAAMVSGNVPHAIKRWRSMVADGVDPLTALDDLSMLVHLVSLAGHDPALLADSGLSGEDAARLRKAHDRYGLAWFMQAQRQLFDSRPVVKDSPDTAAAAEILVLRITQGFAEKSGSGAPRAAAKAAR